MKLRTTCDPEANGRQPQPDDVRYTLTFPLENGEELVVQMGKKGRDLLLGMLICEEEDSK